MKSNERLFFQEFKFKQLIMIMMLEFNYNLCYYDYLMFISMILNHFIHIDIDLKKKNKSK